MTRADYDLIVLGTGPAASTVASKVRKAGKRVAIIEKREFGGTCALRGCNPKKVYTNAGSLLEQVRHADGSIIRTDQPRIVWSDLLQFKKQFTEPVLEKSKSGFEEDGIATFRGTPAFTGEHSLVLGDQTLSADKFLIAVGGRPMTLGVPGEEHLTSSADFLELEEMPRRVLFVGGGYISMEFAHAVAQSGSEVTIVEQGPRILDAFDADLVEQLTAWSRKQSISFQFNAEVTQIERRGEEFVVTYACNGKNDKEDSVACDLVVHGAGRTPELDGLELDKANIEAGKRGIAVDEFLRSPTNPDVYAAGDCAATGAPQLTPVANEDARVAAKNILAETPEHRPSYEAVPQVAFTSPNIAAVGMSDEEARELGREIDVRHEDISGWSSIRKSGHGCAAYKMIVDKENNLLLGAHLLHPAAGDLINLLALAMKNRLTTRDIKSTLFAFPTFSSDLRKML